MAEQNLSRLEHQRIIRRKSVEDRTGLSRSTLYLYISKGKFPAPIAIGDRAVGWVESAVDNWINQQIEQSRKEVIA